MKKIFAILILTSAFICGIAAYASDIHIISTGECITADGAVLAPIRRVAEAFGAGVVWDSADGKITLTDNNTRVVLQIGNINAEVNGIETPLVAAPRFSDSWTAMAPIEFIADAFDFDISYNGANIVFNERVKNEITWEQAEKIGDSVHEWSMNKPNEFLLSYRSIDETKLEFTKDGVLLSVYSEPLPSGYSYYDDLKTLRADYKDSDIKEQKGDNYITFRAAGDDEAVFIRRVWSEDKLVTVKCYAQSDNDAFNEGVICADSLAVGFEKNAFNMSSAQDGYRRVCADGVNFSIKLPADYRMLNSLTSGHLAFVGKDGRIDVDVSPKTNTAGMLAWNDFSRRLEKIDTEKAEFSRITPHTYTAVDTFSYTVKTFGRPVKYIFFTSGDTEYRISISGELDEKRELEIMNSIIPATPDKEYTLYELLPHSDSFKTGTDVCSFMMPGSYVPSKSGGYCDRTTGAEFELYYAEEREWTTKKSLAHAREMAERSRENGAVITAEPSRIMIAKSDYYSYSAEYPDGIRERVFTAPKDSREVMIRARIPEMYDTEAYRGELEAIIASIKVK